MTHDRAAQHYALMAAQAAVELPTWESIPAMIRKIRHAPTVDELKAVLTTLGSIVGDLDHRGDALGWDDVGDHLDIALEKCDSVYLAKVEA